MIDPDTNPIVVDPNQIPAQLGVLLRYALSALGGYLLAKGWIDSGLLEALTNVVLLAAPLLYAAWRAHQQKRALVALATEAPNGIVKGADA